METLQKQLSEVIKEALAVATPGPWRTYQKEYLMSTDGKNDNYRSLDSGKGFYEDDKDRGFGADLFISVADANLIINCRTWLQQLLEENDQQAKEIEKLREIQRILVLKGVDTQ